MAGFPARANPRPGEVDVAGIAFAGDVGGIEPHDMHERSAAPGRELFQLGRVTLGFGYFLDQLADDAAKPMQALLAGNVAVVTAPRTGVPPRAGAHLPAQS